MNIEGVFRYSYSARNNEEILAIRSKYLPKSESKLEELKELDTKVKRPANVFAYIFGTISAIIMGCGMSLAMTDISGLSIFLSMLIGIPVGLVGIVLVALAYPLYRSVLKKARKRIAPEIIRLSDELLK